MKSKQTQVARLGVFIFVVLVIGMSGLLWWGDGTSAVDVKDTTPKIFSVKTGESVRSVANRLSEEKLIRSPIAFFVLVKFMGLDDNIQAGDFRLNASMNAKSVAQELTHGIVDAWVTTLEGWRVEEIATKLAKELDIPEGEFLRVAREGYMFPDTYLIPRSATAAAIVSLLEDTFKTKITSEIINDAKKRGLTESEVIILASIVEREGRNDVDRPIIAGILLKRLQEKWPLQADATLQYALGYQSSEKSWWKKSLTVEDKKINSPFNTYEHFGLPPAPISNPGLASIRAVVYPVDSDYWYYLHDPKGVAHYAKTLEEHETNIKKFLR